MSRKDVVRSTVLALLLALGTWGAIAIAQAPDAGDAGLPGEDALTFEEGPGFDGAGMGMGTGPGLGFRARHGRGGGMGMGRGYGHGGGFGMGRGRGPGVLAHREELGLSRQQQDRIEAIHDAQRREGIEKRKDLELAQLDMRKLMRDDSPDRRAIDAQIDRIAAMRAQLHKARLHTMLDVRDVLTPQQKQKLEQLRERGPGDRDSRPGPGGARRGAGGGTSSR